MDQNFIKQRAQDNEDDLILLDLLESGSEKKIANYKSYIDRYFTKYYKINLKYAGNDHLILMHSNKIAVCSLAPSHPILNLNRYKIDRVEYLQNVNDEMSGKHKHNANNVNINQPICKLYAKVLNPIENEETERFFIIYSCLNAKLIEINEKLLRNPELVQLKPNTDGFIAIMMPKLDNLKDQLSELINHDQYSNEVKNQVVK
jgi:hypothetical protein